jgi:CheY-like chemotaxis protein
MNPDLIADARDGGLVLIVDDVPDNLAVLHDALDESGYTVLVATHGEAALQRAAQAQPDVILLDAVMPGLDGFEVARRLKADPVTAGIPIIFMTGLTETDAVVEAFAAGGADYVTKPLRPREVLARLATHLRSARDQRQARNALDAFGHATLVVRERDGRRLWQTALARRLMAEVFPEIPELLLPAEVSTWLVREGERRRAGGGDAAADQPCRPAPGLRPAPDAGGPGQRGRVAAGAARDLGSRADPGPDAGVAADRAGGRGAALGHPGQDQPRHRRDPGHQPAHGAQAPGARLREAGVETRTAAAAMALGKLRRGGEGA